MRNWICTAIGIIGGAITTFMGGWDMGIMTLIVCMGTDYIFGLIVAGVFHASKKTENGRLSSNAGWKGLLRKVCILMLVCVGSMLDRYLGMGFLRDAIVIAFICNEVISIVENLGLMGIPIPKKLKDAIEILKAKSE